MTENFHRLPRLYTTDTLSADYTINLTAEQAHYLKNVLRKKEGDPIRAFNGKDGEWMLEIHDLSKKSGTAAAKKQLKQQPETQKEIHLLFAPIKKARMDFLIEKAVELGATHLHPVLTEHTEVRKLNEERIKTQIIEAAEQCERLDIPKFFALRPLYEALQTMDSNLNILAGIERQEDVPYISDIKKNYPIAVLVGPEGGFSSEEISQLAKIKNVTPVSLGQNILRAETAALKFLSCLQSP